MITRELILPGDFVWAPRLPLNMYAKLGVLLGIFSLLLTPIPALAVSPESKYAYISFAYMAPKAKFGGSYRSYKPDGSANIKFLDPADTRAEDNIPWISLGLQIGGIFWLGGDYLGMEGNSEGEIGKRVRFGPFRFFITAPTQEHYRFDIGRLWLGYRLIDQANENLLLLLGLTAIRAKATAAVEGLGQESTQGTLPMPMVGFTWHQSGAYGTQWSLSADYSKIEINDIFGRARNISGTIEKPLDIGFSIGLGYKQYDLTVRANRPSYKAELQQKISGPFLFIQKVF